eukprot:5544008-Prymnesium_polylepis.1
MCRRISACPARARVHIAQWYRARLKAAMLTRRGCGAWAVWRAVSCGCVLLATALDAIRARVHRAW